MSDRRVLDTGKSCQKQLTEGATRVDDHPKHGQAPIRLETHHLAQADTAAASLTVNGAYQLQRWYNEVPDDQPTNEDYWAQYSGYQMQNWYAASSTVNGAGEIHRWDDDGHDTPPPDEEYKAQNRGYQMQHWYDEDAKQQSWDGVREPQSITWTERTVAANGGIKDPNDGFPTTEVRAQATQTPGDGCEKK